MKIHFPKNLIIYVAFTVGSAAIAIGAQYLLLPPSSESSMRSHEVVLTGGLAAEIQTPATVIEGRIALGSLTVRSHLQNTTLIAGFNSEFDVLPEQFLIPLTNGTFSERFSIVTDDVGGKTLQLRFALGKPNANQAYDPSSTVSLRIIYIPITVVPTPIHRIKLSLGIFVPLLAVLLIAWKYATRAREHERRIDQKVEQAESKALAEPEKAKYAWDVARINLEAYFERNRTQVSQVFIIAVIVMSIGFILVCFGVYLAMTRSDTIKPALVAGISGIITQFIGATFMVIYRSTMTQANEFMLILERINTVGMAVQVLDSIPESETALKNESRTKIVELLLSANISTTISTAKKSKAATA